MVRAGGGHSGCVGRARGAPGAERPHRDRITSGSPRRDRRKQ
jgi:hypothetical protein